MFRDLFSLKKIDDSGKKGTAFKKILFSLPNQNIESRLLFVQTKQTS